MNYAGTFDATFAAEGPDTHSHAYTHVDSSHTHAPADAIIVPDAQLLFHADYSRSGTDLILSRDHHEYVLHDYFKGEKRAPLASADGAHLTADIVKALVGEVQVSQAGTAPAASQVIGHVTKMQGSATVIRNGVSIILNMGDNVEKGDVVESGANATVGITFIDGTVFGLSSNARMVLNEMVYDPNGSNNSSLLSLVAGTITFVAGETAKHGDMKIDTPVATMGIRGTAVLVEIDFSVAGQNGQPNASFQVLVEPDGTTGSYILFDKTTLQPIAIVNQAGQQININNGIINLTTNPLPPDVQKLITDVFQQKFTDNTNTKSTTPSTDSIIPTSSPLVIKTADGTPVTATTVSGTLGSSAPPPSAPGASNNHVDVAPQIKGISNLFGVATTSFSTAELVGQTGSPLPDATAGIVTFIDINKGDTPSISTAFSSFTYQDGHGHNVTAGLSALQLADIAATEVKLTTIPGAYNPDTGGSTLWTYSIADSAFDFLAAGETITLTYLITLNNNYAPSPLTATASITITITGTNDQPVITTGPQTIEFAAGTTTQGGNLPTHDPTSGTLAFTDVDLTDTHTVSKKLVNAVMSNGGTVPPLPEQLFESALTASVGTDSTGTGNGVINWHFADLPVYVADFIPTGQTVTLTYVVTVTDSQGATYDQTITVVIAGTEAAAEVWIHTTTDGHDNLWTNGLNWETGNAPVATDDVIIITDQLHPNTPAYPVVIAPDPTSTDPNAQKGLAFAHSVTMNDFGDPSDPAHVAPELDVALGGSLTIGAALDLGADSKLDNAGTVTVGGKIELQDSLVNVGTPGSPSFILESPGITNTGTINAGGATELLDLLDSGGNLLSLTHSVIVNSGTINLKQGGDFQGLASVTNTGTIDVQGGVLNVLVDIANFSTDTTGHIVGGQIAVESGAKLALGTDTNTGGGSGGITGGTLTIIGELDLQGSNFLDSGTLDNNGHVFVTGLLNSFDGETITNSGAIEVETGAALTIDQSSSVSGSGTITVDDTATLTLNDATITGGTVTNNNGGTIDLTGSAILQTGSLGNSGQINVSGTGNALHDETVTANNALEILAAGALTIDQGSSVTNGTLTVDGTATLTVNGASITGGTVTNNSGGTIDLTGSAILQTGSLGNSGQINVSGTGNALHDETVTANNALEILSAGGLTIDQGSSVTNGALTVDGTATLTVNDATITGGTVTNKSGGTIDLTGSAILQNGSLGNSGQINVSGAGSALHDENVTANNALEILSAGALIIDQGSSVTNGALTVDGTATLTLNDATITGGTVTNKSGGTIDLTGSAILQNGSLGNSGQINVSGTGNALHDETVTANNALEILAAGALNIDQGSSVTNGALTVDGTATLTVKDATISGGAVTNKSGGTIDLTGSAVLQTGSLGNSGQINVSGAGSALHDENVTANNALEILSAGALIIDQGSSVTNGALTVDGTATLTLNDATITGGTVTNKSGGTIDLTGSAILQNGSLGNSGQINVSGTGNALHDETVIANNALEILSAGALTIDQGSGVTNGALTVDGTATLTVNGASITGGTVTNNSGGTIDLTGSAILQAGSLGNSGQINVSGTGNALHDENVTANNALEILAAGTLTVDQGSKIANTALTIDSGGALTLEDTSYISGGMLTNAGDFYVEASTGAALDDVSVHNVGGTVHVDGVTSSTPATLIIENGTTISGGKILIGNVGTLEVSGSAGAELLGGVVVTNGSLVQVDNGSTLTLSDASITGGSLTNAGTLDNLSGTNTISAAVTNTGTIEVQSGTLDLAGGVTGGGQLIVDAGATLELGGADAETVTLEGGTGTTTLQLDSTAVPFIGTMTVNATGGGTFDVNGQGSITTTSGDGLDVNASGGTSGNPANVTVNLGGAITGAANGIVVTQSGYGSLTVDTTSAVTGNGTGDDGLLVQNLNAGNNANISVTATGGASGDLYGIDVLTDGNGDITVESNGAVSAPDQYGIRLRSFGTGSETLTTDSGSSVTSGSSGLVAVNRATAVDASDHSTITVTANGTINSGTIANLSGTAPAGILAGYNGIGGTGSQANTQVNGTVTVNNYANITAASGEGIDAYNYGNGDVIINDEANTVVTGADYGIFASALSGGTGNVTVAVAANAAITGTSAHAIVAENTGAGNVTVTTSDGDTIKSGAGGIAAYNSATSLAAGTTISVTARGTINSGTSNNPGGTSPGGIEAGYFPGSQQTANGNVAGNVFIDSYATIMAAAGYGIDGYNWGTGDVTITAEATSSITATGTLVAGNGTTGIGIGAFANDGGNVSVTQDKGAIDTGLIGLSAQAFGAGTITITNGGQITGTSGQGILVKQATNATGSTTITNSGAVTGSTTAIVVHENTTGLATIDNTGTIGPAAVTATSHAIFEDGGNVSIDNHGTIDGMINVANGTFTNETDGIWNAGGSSLFGTSSGTGFTIDNEGTVNLSQSASLSGAHGLTITDSGTIDGVSGSDAINGANVTITGTGVLESTGGTLTIDAQSQITNDAGGTVEASGGGTLDINGAIDNAGTITANGGTVNIAGAVTDTGSATIANSGILHFQSNVASTQTVTFADATGTLAVSDPADFYATIAGFGTGDKIDLTGVALAAGEYDIWTQGVGGGTLSIYSGSTLEAQLKLSGTYTQGDFALANDGNGDTDIVWSKAQGATASGLDNAGNPVAGYSATAHLNDANAGNITYTWLENGQVVQSGSNASFTPASPLEVGKTLDVVIGFTDNGVSEQITELAGTVAAAPAVTFGTTNPVSTTEDAALALNGLSASFADAGTDTITATISVVDGTLTIADEHGTGTVNNAASITLTGTLAQIDLALASGVTYAPNGAFAGNDTLSFSISDPTSGNTFAASGTQTIAVNPVAPMLTVASHALEMADNGTIALNISETPFDPRDTVSITISNVPADATLSAGTNDGGGAWTLTPAELAGLTFKAGVTSAPDLVVSATNTAGATATSTQAIDVTVIPPPAFSGANSISGHEHAAIQLGITDTDSTNGMVTVTGLPDDLTGVSAGGTYTAGTNGNSGTWTGTAAQFSALSFTTGTAGTFDLTVSATNGVGETTTQNYVLTVDVDHWQGASADWNTGADWSYGSAPGSNIDAVVDASGAYAVAITGADVANSLTITAAGAGADIQDEAGGLLTLSGALTINAGSFSLIGGSLSAASIDVESTGHFIAEGSVSAPITNNGIVKALGTLSLSGVLTDNGTVEIDGILQLTGGARVQGPSSTQLGIITNLGLLEILGAATLVDVTVTNAGHNIQVDPSQTLSFDNSTITSGTLTVTGELDSTGTSFITGTTIINQTNIHVVSGSLTIDPAPVTNTGTIEAMAGATLVIDAETITNSSSGKKGTIQVDGQATLDLQGSEIDGGNIIVSGELVSTGTSVISGATIINNGIIDIAGGNLTIDATSVLSGTGGFKMDGGSLVLNGALVGNLEISGASIIELGSKSPTAYSSTTVTFDGGSTGTLKLDFAEDFGGKVIGFATGQTLDLADVAYTSKPTVVYTGDASGGVMAVYVNGQDVANINLAGNYLGVQWILSSDGQHGTDIKEYTGGVLAATLDHSSAQQGVTLHVTKVTDGGTSVTSGLAYAWQMSTDGKSWTTVGTGSSFTPGEAQEGHLMQLVVAYTNASGTQDAVYNLGMPNDLTVTVDQTMAQQGLPIHVTNVSDGGTAVSSGVSYLWETSIDGQHWTQVGNNSSSYTPSFTTDGGKFLQLVVSYSDPGEHESVTESFGAVALAKEWTGGSHTWETSQSWNPASAPTSSDDAVVDASGHFTVTVDQATAAAHSLVENASQATVDIARGGMLTLGGNLVIDQGHLQVDSGGTLKDIATSATITGSFTDNGTVEASGKLEIASTVTGSGTFKIDAGATLQLDHAGSENVVFTGQGTLALQDPTHFSGIVSDSTGSMTNKDVLDLAGFDAKASVNYIGTTLGGVVVVSENNETATILVGANTTHWTNPVSDGHGGILIEDPVQNDAAAVVKPWMADNTDKGTQALTHDASHAWSAAGADSFVFKIDTGSNAAFDADHSPVWPEPGHPDSVGKLTQFLQSQAAELPNIPGLHDAVTADSLKTQLLLHHNEFHFV